MSRDLTGIGWQVWSNGPETCVVACFQEGALGNKLLQYVGLPPQPPHM